MSNILAYLHLKKLKAQFWISFQAQMHWNIKKICSVYSNYFVQGREKKHEKISLSITEF